MLAIPALILLQVVTQKPGLLFLWLMMFFAGVFFAPVLAFWLNDERDRMNLKTKNHHQQKQIVFLAPQESAISWQQACSLLG